MRPPQCKGRAALRFSSRFGGFARTAAKSHLPSGAGLTTLYGDHTECDSGQDHTRLPSRQDIAVTVTVQSGGVLQTSSGRVGPGVRALPGVGRRVLFRFEMRFWRFYSLWGREARKKGPNTLCVVEK